MATPPVTARGDRTHLLAPVLAVAAAAVVFGPALRPGHTLSGGDLVLWVPQFITTYREGLFFPRWFPYFYAGLAQQFQFLSQAAFTMVLVPPFYFHAAEFALDVVIASVGMWYLARSWGLRAGACAVGALAYPLSNHMLTWVQAGHLWKYDTTCWTPWLLLALDRAQATGRVRWFVWAGFFLGLHLLGGDVQLAYYVGLVLTLYTVLRVLWRWRGGRAGARPPLETRSIVRQVLGHALCVAIAAGFGAEVIQHYVHLLRTQEVVAEPSKEGHWRFATEFSLPPEETAALAVGGGLFGHSLDGPHYWGRAVARATDDYLGIVALCFGVCALAVRRDRYALFWGVLGIGALLLAYGKYVPWLYRPIYGLPFMSLLRNPNRWLFVTAWAAAVLSALGADAWLRAGDDPVLRPRLQRVLWAAGGCALLALLVAAWQQLGTDWWRSALYTRLSRGGVDAGEVAYRFQALRTEWLRAALLLTAWVGLTASWLLGGASWSRSAGRGVAIACVFLVGADLAGHAQPFIRTYDAGATFAESALAETLLAPPLGGRTKLWSESPALHREVTQRFPYFGVPSIDVISSRRPPEYTALLAAWRAGTLPPALVLRLFHVTTLLSTGPLGAGAPPAEPVAVIQGIYVAALRDASPRAEVIGDFNVLEPTAILRRMGEPDFDAAAEVLLDTRPPVRLAEFQGPLQGTAEVETDTPHTLALRVTASRPALVLVHDLYDQYWRATVDGEPAPVVRADGFLRAVPVPAGTNMAVTLTYAPPRWPWVLSLAGWIGLAGSAVAAAWRGWRPARPVEAT